MNNRITLSDYIQNEFYQLPKIFFDKDSKYFGMSMNAKVLYSLLRNRLELSKKNNWVNSDGEVYLIMTRLEAAEMLGIGETMARKAFHELEQIGLIEDVRQKSSLPNLIYLYKCELSRQNMTVVPSEYDGTYHQNMTVSNNDIKKNDIKKNEIIKEIYKEKSSESEIEKADSNVKVVSMTDAVKQIYNAYPRKLGKAKGVEYILAYLGKGRKVAGFGNIKFNHEELYCAVKHYSIECERNETESDFIKHFSTFMNKDIIDYVDLAKEKGYEDYMERTYGSDWRKVKFVYKQ